METGKSPGICTDHRSMGRKERGAQGCAPLLRQRIPEAAGEVVTSLYPKCEKFVNFPGNSAVRMLTSVPCPSCARLGRGKSTQSHVQCQKHAKKTPHNRPNQSNSI